MVREVTDDAFQKQIDYLAGELSKLEGNMIDPRDFGRLEAEVHGLRQQVSDLSKNVESLLEIANKSKGAMWIGMGLVGFFSSVATVIVGKVLTLK